MSTMLKKMLLKDECDQGVPLKIYPDSLGVPTIGVGRNLRDKGISIKTALQMLEEDIIDAQLDAATVFGADFWLTISEPRKDAILNMLFNLGRTKFLRFKKMIACIKSGDWDGAAREALNSVWATQVGDRAKRIATLLKDEIYNY